MVEYTFRYWRIGFLPNRKICLSVPVRVLARARTAVLKPTNSGPDSIDGQILR